jgi:hypothetical protein
MLRIGIASLLLCACGQQGRPVWRPADPPPVLPYSDGWGLCSAVVIGEGRVMTAWHCTRDMPGAGVVLPNGKTLAVRTVLQVGPDVAELAVPGLPSMNRAPRPVPYVAGYGCGSTMWRFELGVRVGGVCKGDSGGGIFDANGDLAGILQDTSGPPPAYEPCPRSDASVCEF